MSTADASNATGSASGSGSGTRSYAACLPTFWSTRPELWFAQAVATFQDRDPLVTTDQAKYNMVLWAPPNEVIEAVEHIITGKEQVGGRYPVLRNALT